MSFTTDPINNPGDLGINPPNKIFALRNPTSNDTNANIGDEWYNKATTPYTVWKLVYLFSGQATWRILEQPGGDVETLSSNSGGTITPDASGNIAVVGDGTTITGVGDPLTNTITFSLTGGGVAVDSFTVPFGTSPVVPDAGGVVDWPAGNGWAATGGLNSMTGNMVSPFTGTFGFTDVVSGSTQVVYVENTSDTASSDAVFSAISGGTSGGDPYCHFVIPATRFYSWGIDNSDSDIFKLNTDVSPVSPSTGTELFIMNTSADAASGSLSLGHNGTPIIDINFTINGASVTSVLSLSASSANDLAGFVDKRHTDIAGIGAHEIFLRSRGDFTTQTVVQSGDLLSLMTSCGYDGTDYAQAASIGVFVDGTPGANDMPGRMILSTSADGAQTPIERIRIASTGVITFNTAYAFPTADGTINQVLATNGAGVLSFTSLSGISVTSITGTANQVLANATSGTPQTGAVTVAFPATAGISIGSYQATTAPVGGIICPGAVGIGTNNPGINSTTTKLDVAGDSALSGSTDDAQLRVIGASNSNFKLLIGYDTANSYSFMQTTESGVAFRNMVIQPLGAGLSIGTSNAPLSKVDINGSVSIGTYAGSSAAPANGLSVSGLATFGTAQQGDPGLTFPLIMGPGAGSRAGFNIYLPGGAADAKWWTFSSDSSTSSSLFFFAQNDALNATSSWMTVTRSGLQPTTIEFSTNTNSCLYMDGSQKSGFGTSSLASASRVTINGGIATAPVSSNTATAAFGSLVLTTPRQNTTGYDILVTVQIYFTAATTATIVAGASSSATPTTDIIFPSFTVVAFTPFSFSMIVPNNYYMLVDTTGAVTVTSITTVASPL